MRKWHLDKVTNVMISGAWKAMLASRLTFELLNLSASCRAQVVDAQVDDLRRVGAKNVAE